MKKYFITISLPIALLLSPLSVGAAVTVTTINQLMSQATHHPITITRTVEIAQTNAPLYKEKRKAIPSTKTCSPIFAGSVEQVCVSHPGTAKTDTKIRYTITQRTVATSSALGFAAEGHISVDRYESSETNPPITPGLPPPLVLDASGAPKKELLSHFNRPVRLEWIMDGERLYTRLTELPLGLWKALQEDPRNATEKERFNHWFQQVRIPTALTSPSSELPLDLSRYVPKVKNLTQDPYEINPKSIKEITRNRKRSITFSLQRRTLKPGEVRLGAPNNIVSQYTIDATTGALQEVHLKITSETRTRVGCKDTVKETGCLNTLISQRMFDSQETYRYDSMAPIRPPQNFLTSVTP